MKPYDQNLQARAARGEPEALCQLGQEHIEGGARFQNEVAGAQLIARAADLGYAKAQYLLALCYGEGVGVARDLAQRNAWLERAAVQEYPPALSLLGCYLNQGKPDTATAARGLQLVRRAAELRDGYAHYLMGHYHETGQGVEPSLPMAHEQYLQALQAKEVNACLRLGEWHLNGIQVLTHPGRALEYFKQAAIQGSAAGQYMAGRCYELGLGTHGDLAQARTCYEQAERLGDLRARGALERLDRLGSLQAALLFVSVGAVVASYLATDRPTARQPLLMLMGALGLAVGGQVLFTARLWQMYITLGGRLQLGLGELLQMVISLCAAFLLFFWHRTHLQARSAESGDLLPLCVLAVLVSSQALGTLTGYVFAQKQRMSGATLLDEQIRLCTGLGSLGGLVLGVAAVWFAAAITRTNLGF